MPTSIEDWRRTRRIASIWYCGDDYCECAQAQVEDVSPNLAAGYPWVKRALVVQGTFFTDGEGAIETQIERDHLALLYGTEN